MKIAEIVNALEAPVYIERVALTTTANIQKAKKAVFKGIKNLKERKGFSLIEVLSACPTNWGMQPVKAMEHIKEEVTQYFPLGVYKDRG